MFRYIPKSMWFPTSVDVKHAATIEELIKLCKEGEVERVIIPTTYYGYGATLYDDSNRRSIKKHYAQNRFKDYGCNLTMSAYQFLKHEEFRELVRVLQEEYAVFNEQDYSELETETLLEFIVDEIETVLDNREATLPGGGPYTKFYIEQILQSGNWDDRIEWWEYCHIDNDGATPYAEKKDIETLAFEVHAKAHKGVVTK